jgi:hypothetical protein
MSLPPIIDGDFYITRDQLLNIKKNLRSRNNANNNAKANAAFDLSDVPSFDTCLTVTEEGEVTAAFKMGRKATEVPEPVSESVNPSSDVLGAVLRRNVGFSIKPHVSALYERLTETENEFKNKISTIYDLFDSLMITLKEETYNECIQKLRVMKASRISHDKENLACIMSHLKFFDPSLHSRVVDDLRGPPSTPSTLSTATSLNNNNNSSMFSRTSSLKSASSFPQTPTRTRSLQSVSSLQNQTPNGSTRPPTGGARRGKLYIA